MHEFGAVKECPKCGGEASWLTRKWEPAHREYRDTLWMHLSRAIPERIKVTCQMCKYTWNEKPKDSK